MLETKIQLFAEGGADTGVTPLVTTNRTTDAVEGNDLSAEIKTYYEKRLINLASPELIFDQFADKYPIPKGNGKSIEFRKFTPLVADLSATTLTEGVTPDGTKLDVQTVSAEITQYGDYVEVSDMLTLTAIDPIVVQATALTGSQAGRVLNKVTREVIAAGTNVRYASKADGTKVERRKDLDVTCKLTPAVIRKAANDLKRVNAPKFDGCYIAVVHPDVATELMGNKEWIEVHQYESTSNIFDGEIGKMAGVRFIENTESKIIKDSTCPEGLAVYFCEFIAKNAYGTTDIEGGGLQHIVKPLGAGNDPLNQRATIGWKATKTAEILVEEYMVRVECCTDDSATVSAN